jgi:RimJ/RimL family protein N-acetyltransferase
VHLTLGTLLPANELRCEHYLVLLTLPDLNNDPEVSMCDEWIDGAPSAWGTGANVEAKLLMLEHAFERLGCVRVEFKTVDRHA